MDNELMTRWEHEHDMARMEIIIKRLWILVIIIFVALVITNGAWLYYESQWEVVEETTTEEVVTQDVKSNGNSDAVVAGKGVVIRLPLFFYAQIHQLVVPTNCTN